jgi:hypothetical protein
MSEENPLPQPEVRSPPTATGSVDPHSVEGLFLAALAKPDPDQRRAFLDEACPDEELRRRVEALLRAYDDAGSFLERPAAGRDGAPGALDAPPLDKVPLDFLSLGQMGGCWAPPVPFLAILHLPAESRSRIGTRCSSLAISPRPGDSTCRSPLRRPREPTPPPPTACRPTLRPTTRPTTDGSARSTCSPSARGAEETCGGVRNAGLRR